MAQDVHSLTGKSPPSAGRSRNMAAIRSKNTRPERRLRLALWERGLRGYRCHHPALPGKPDIAFTRWRVAVFVDGAFWHGHPDHFEFGRLGTYWDEKIRRTRERDAEQQARLLELGYTVLRFWDFEVNLDPGACAARVDDAVRRRRARHGAEPSRITPPATQECQKT